MSTEEQRTKAAAEIRAVCAQIRSEMEPRPLKVRDTDTVTQDREDRICATCSQPFSALVAYLGGRPLLSQQNCADCVLAYEKRTTGAAMSAETRLQAEWRALCPADYRDTDETRLWREVPTDLHSVLQWETGARGIALVGETRRRKTRLMFLLMKRLLQEGRRIRYINAANLADELACVYDGGCQQAEAWMQAIERVDVLFIDDLGKEKLTERVAVFYYRLFEYRKAHALVLFYTANLGRSDLQAKWTAAAAKADLFDDKAAATVARLGELCQSIAL